MGIYSPLITLLQQNATLTPNLVNQPLGMLADRTDFLKQEFDDVQLGENLVLRNAPLLTGVNVGSPVFLDNSSMAYGGAQADLALFDDGTVVNLAPSAFVFGVLAKQYTPSLGDIVLFGRMLLTTTQLTAIFEGPISAGPVWTSAIAAGYMTRTQPAVGSGLIGMLKGPDLAGKWELFVQPHTNANLDGHTHYAYNLTPEYHNAAGSAAGWYDANNETMFGNSAPARAVFGYNIVGDYKLLASWPPIPVSSSYVTVDGAGVPMDVDGECLIDANGIWWMEDCPPRLPFYNAYELSSSLHLEHTCPDYGLQVMLYFGRMTTKTSDCVVTSLTTSSVSPLSITDKNGNPAEVGDLLINVKGDLTTTDTSDNTDLVVKSATGFVLNRGPVVSGIVAGSNRVIISSTRTTTPGLYQGAVTIDLPSNPANREGLVDLVALDGVREETYQNIPYLGFPPSVLSSFRGRIGIPAVDMPINPRLVLHLWFLASATMNLPTITMSYRVISPPSADKTVTSLPLVDTAVDLSSILATCPTLAANQYITVSTPAFNVAAGSEVYFTLQRNGTTDSVSQEVGLLIPRWSIQN